MCSPRGIHAIYVDGFPHSEIHGSMLACSSPWLIAACYVLLRCLASRHPPCAQGMFSLTRWSSQIPTGFPGSRSTRVPSHSAPMLSPTGLSPSAAGLSRPLRLAWPHHCLLAWARIKRSHDPQPATPQGFYARSGLGLFPVRSPLLRESLLFSFPPGTEMVQFPRFPPLRLS